MILETNKPIWHIRVVAAIIFILLISNFSNIAICLTVLFIFIFSCLIENSSWNSISWKELLMLLTKFSNYNDKFAFDSGITLSVTAAKDVSFRLLSEQFDAINSIKKSLQIAWWFSFILGLIYPIIYSKIFKA